MFAGQYATTGQLVMLMGSTGTGANGTVHLHLELRKLPNVKIWSDQTPYDAYCVRPQVVAINQNQTPPFLIAYSYPGGQVYTRTCSV